MLLFKSEKHYAQFLASAAHDTQNWSAAIPFLSHRRVVLSVPHLLPLLAAPRAWWHTPAIPM
jgi:hypothetical protein